MKEQAVHFNMYGRSGEGQNHIGGCATSVIFTGAQGNWKAHFFSPESHSFFSRICSMLSTISADLCFLCGICSKDKIDVGVNFGGME